MADNVTLPGAGGVIASDEVSGAQYQRVKLSLGADGTASDAPVGAGTEAGVLRVTLANDSTGVLSVDDNGGALTVDGTVTAELSATDNAVLDAIALAVATEGDALGDGVLIQGDDGTDRTNVLVDTAGHLQVDVVSAPSTAVTNTGTFAVQSAATLSAETTKVIGTVNIASSQTVGLAAGTAEIGKLAAGVAAIGSVTIAGNGKTRVSGRVAATASQTGGTVWDPTAGKKFALTKLIISASAAGAIQLFDQTDSGNTVVGPIVSLAANGGWDTSWPMDMPYLSATADNILKYTSSAGIAASIYYEGWEV